MYFSDGPKILIIENTWAYVHNINICMSNMILVIVEMLGMDSTEIPNIIISFSKLLVGSNLLMM